MSIPNVAFKQVGPPPDLSACDASAARQGCRRIVSEDIAVRLDGLQEFVDETKGQVFFNGNLHGRLRTDEGEKASETRSKRGGAVGRRVEDCQARSEGAHLDRRRSVERQQRDDLEKCRWRDESDASGAVPAAPDLVQRDDAAVLHDALQNVSELPCELFKPLSFVLDHVERDGGIWHLQTELGEGGADKGGFFRLGWASGCWGCGQLVVEVCGEVDHVLCLCHEGVQVLQRV